MARGVGVTVVTGPAEGPMSTGEDDAHTPWLEEVLFDAQQPVLASYREKPT